MLGGGDNMGVQNDNLKNEGRSFEDAMRRTKPIVAGMTEDEIKYEMYKMLASDIDRYIGKNVSSVK